MSLSPKFIQGKLVTKVQELVKGKIWEYEDGTPAVFKSNAFRNKTPPSPEMPYIEIDFMQTLVPFNDILSEGWMDGEDFGETGDVYVTLQSKIMQFNIKVYGSGDDDTLEIASDLSLKFKSSYHRDYFYQYEVGVYSISNPITSSLRLTNQYRDVASFTLSLSYVDRVIDLEGAGVISSAEITSP